LLLVGSLVCFAALGLDRPTPLLSDPNHILKSDTANSFVPPARLCLSPRAWPFENPYCDPLIEGVRFFLNAFHLPVLPITQERLEKRGGD
jgi:hypothetical protein